MPYGVSNPYGAVPASLKELRLSMTDILNNMIQSKELDRQATRDLATAELAKANVEAGTQRFGIEMAGKEKALDLESLWKGREFGLRQEQLAGEERGRTLQAIQAVQAHGLAEKRVGIEKGRAKFEETKYAEAAPLRQEQLTAAQRQNTILGIDIDAATETLKKTRAANEMKSVAEHIRENGWPSWVAGALGISPDTMMRGDKFADRMGGVAKTLNTDTYSFATANQHKIMDEVGTIRSQLAKLPVGDPQRQVLIDKNNENIKQFDELESFVQTIKMSPQQIVKEATSAYSKDPSLQVKYPEIDDFIKAYSKGIETLKSKHSEARTKYGKLFELTPEERIENEKKKKEEKPVTGGVPGIAPENKVPIVELGKRMGETWRGMATEPVEPPSGVELMIPTEYGGYGTGAKPPTTETNVPPVAGAKKAKDGKWYIEKNGKYFEVVK